MFARDARSLFCLALICAHGLPTLGADTARAQSPSEERARVLFLLPKVEASVRAQLREALEAQLSLVAAELLIEDDAPQAIQAALAERIESAQALAQGERADVVLWLDPGRGVWLLHVLDVGQDRMVVRRIDASNQSAAFEAIAVLTREASRGGPIADVSEAQEGVAQPEPAAARAEPAAPPAASTPPAAMPPPQKAALHGLRLSLFYSGVDFSPDTSFSHAMGIGARLDWRSGLFLAVHGGWAALAKARPIAVQRIPLGAAAGYRTALLEGLWTDLELGFLVDVLHRTTRPGPMLYAFADEPRAAVALAPRLRAEYRPATFLGVFAGFGLDLVLTPVPYVFKDTVETRKILTPNVVRPALEAGLAFYP